MRMLDEQQNVSRRLKLLARDELLLERERREVIHAAESFVDQHNELYN
jgi:hypothetical protein